MHDLKDLFEYVIDNSNSARNAILQTLESETWPTIEKYYYGTYSSKVTQMNNPDLKNEAERYPDVKVAYDVADAFEWVTHGLIEQIKSDITFLERKFAQAKRDLA